MLVYRTSMLAASAWSPHAAQEGCCSSRRVPLQEFSRKTRSLEVWIARDQGFRNVIRPRLTVTSKNSHTLILTFLNARRTEYSHLWYNPNCSKTFIVIVISSLVLTYIYCRFKKKFHIHKLHIRSTLYNQRQFLTYFFKYARYTSVSNNGGCV